MAEVVASEDQGIEEVRLRNSPLVVVDLLDKPVGVDLTGGITEVVAVLEHLDREDHRLIVVVHPEVEFAEVVVDFDFSEVIAVLVAILEGLLHGLDGVVESGVAIFRNGADDEHEFQVERGFADAAYFVPDFVENEADLLEVILLQL